MVTLLCLLGFEFSSSTYPFRGYTYTFSHIHFFCFSLADRPLFTSTVPQISVVSLHGYFAQSTLLQKLSAKILHLFLRFGATTSVIVFFKLLPFPDNNLKLQTKPDLGSHTILYKIPYLIRFMRLYTPNFGRSRREIIRSSNEKFRVGVVTLLI